MNRRAFLMSLGAAAGGLILPYEPRRVYSFPSVVKTDYWDGLTEGSMSATARQLEALKQDVMRNLYAGSFEIGQDHAGRIYIIQRDPIRYLVLQGTVTT